MKTNLLCLLALLLLLGCNKEKEAAEPDHYCYPESQVRTYVTGHTNHFGFEYNEQGQLSKRVISTGDIKYTLLHYYQAGNLIATGSPEVVYTKFYYDEKNRLIRLENLNNTNQQEIDSYYLYIYDSKNRLKQVDDFSRTGGELKQLYRGTFQYPSAQSVRITYTLVRDGSNAELELHLTYDNKKSPFWALPAYRNVGDINALPLPKHNIMSLVYKRNGEVLEHHSYTSTFDYTPEGYPKTEYRKFMNGTNEHRYDYTYTCH
jgi:hypothetical protein